MKYHVVDSTEWLYPDKRDYETSCYWVDQCCARNGKACAQILVYDAGEEVKLSVKGFDAEIYEEIAVPVEENIGFNKDNRNKFFPSRLAPFRVFDALKPYDGSVRTENGLCAFYVCLNAESLGGAGKFHGSIILQSGSEEIEITATVRVFDFMIPEETLKVVMGSWFGAAAALHGVKVETKEYEELRIAYMKVLRRMRQNMLYVSVGRAISLGDGKYSFDFSGLEREVEEAQKLGFKYFFTSGVGFRRSWSASAIKITLVDIDATSPEGRVFLAQYIPAFRDFLREKGWLDCFYIGVADEPNDENALEYKELCNIIRSHAPELKLADALSYNKKLDGALDVWIPLNKEYQAHRTEFEGFRGNGAEIWQYVCCGPRADGFVNRFLDYPLICSRYQFWGNYKYDLTGYLHWAAFAYQPDQDPWVQSCPRHVNADSVSTLPAGDTHLVYPGDGQPYMSIRLEAHREGLEDYEILRYIGSKNKLLADDLIHNFKAFDKVEFDMLRFRNSKLAIYKAMEDLSK